TVLSRKNHIMNLGEHFENSLESRPYSKTEGRSQKAGWRIVSVFFTDLIKGFIRFWFYIKIDVKSELLKRKQ
ncbi:hypothetical protein, partial [Moorena sp. SIO3H5]|uniref:hypothetical protein n=1 Tax=Moorena sp. SIO3H5 TaxID=2607834 RepID=UPI0025E029E6